MRIGDGLRIAVAGVCATVALGLPSIAAAGETIAQDFTVAGEHEFVVPPGVSSVMTTIGGSVASTHGGFPGGTGATVIAGNAVGDSRRDTVCRGCRRRDHFAFWLCGSPGGYGGGGAGGDRHSFGTFVGGGGGGGASDLQYLHDVSSCTANPPHVAASWPPWLARARGDEETLESRTPQRRSAVLKSPARRARWAEPARRASSGGTGGRRHGTASAGGDFGEPMHSACR